MTHKTITFETKCYENDWEFLLKTPLLEKMIKNQNFKFDKKFLFINNVKDRSLVEKYAKIAKKNKVIDNYYFVEDYAKKALVFFGIDPKSFNEGYNYSISELVSIYLVKTDYILHCSSDVIIKNNNSLWIKQAVEKIEKTKDIFVANPRWTNNIFLLKIEAIKEDKYFYYGLGFSDQCYLVKTKNMKKKIYNEKNIYCEKRYPSYGGNLFEKRVNAYMRNHELKRITSKKSIYLHKNFPKAKLLKKIELYLISHLKFDRVLSDYYGDIKKFFIKRISNKK